MREYICIYDEDEMQFIPSPYADTEELIRCKDCKYWSKQYRWCGFNDMDVEPDDFCSKAERKEE